MEAKEDLFENMPVARAVRQMAVPAILSQLVIVIYNVAATFYIGQTNDPFKVAGVSLILPVFNITLALGTLIGTGGGAFIPKLMSRAKKEEAERVTRFCMWAGVLITGLVSLILLLFAEPILRTLGAGSDTLHYAKTYMLIVVAAGGIPTVLNNIVTALLRSIGLSKEAGIGIALGGILNLVLDPLFMFVLLPRGNEVLGVAVAAFISNVIACSYSLVIMLRKQKQLYLAGPIAFPEGKSVAAVFSVGIPAAMNIFLFDLDYMVLNRLMSGHGDKALAAIGIVLKAERFPIQAAVGICYAMIPLIAYSYAKGDHRRMRGIIRESLKLTVIISLGCIALYQLFAPQIIRIFIKEAETVSYGVPFLRVRAVATFLMIMSFFIVHVFQGMGDGKTAFALCTVRWAVFNIPMLFLLNYLLGIMGLCYAQIAADSRTVTVSFIVYRRKVGRLA